MSWLALCALSDALAGRIGCVHAGATGTTTGFAAFRALRESDPQLVRDMLQLLAERIAQYALYQIDSGLIFV